MYRASVPIIAQHESWISLDPIQGCPAQCAYCYLGPQQFTHQAPQILEQPEAIYHKLQNYRFFHPDWSENGLGHRRLPICIGNYTDMCLTPANRSYLLDLLHEHQRVMPYVPVCIVTKGVLEDSFLHQVNDTDLQIIFFISGSFLPKEFEKGTPDIETRLENFERIAKYPNLRAVHFWRPITSLNVPDQLAAQKQINMLQQAGAKVSVAVGLKFGNNLEQAFRGNPDHPFHSYFTTHIEQNSTFNEIFEAPTRDIILNTAREMNYPVYLHTSCALSYVLYQRDYNATFRKPYLANKCLASHCPSTQRELCFSYKNKYETPSQPLMEDVAKFLSIPVRSVVYSSEQDIIFVQKILTQEEQTFLTQATSFPVRGERLVPTLEWVGSINRRFDMQVAELITMTREIIALFQQIEPRRWEIEAMMTELTGEVGTLADSVMTKEGYRRLREGDTLDLEDDLADVMFMLIRIADYYHIDFEASYKRMIDLTRMKLENQLRENKGD